MKKEEKTRVLFIDRDGTLIREPQDEQIDAFEKLEFYPGVFTWLGKIARELSYELVMVTNQDGLGTSSFPREAFDVAHRHLLQILNSQGIELEAEFVCPHLPADGCACRKPATGLLAGFLARTHLDATRSAVIGDRETDMELAGNLGLRGFRIEPGNRGNGWLRIADELCSMPRRASVVRRTKETDIRATVALDVGDPVSMRSGIGFFDHMLEQIARHSGCSMQIECSGDLHIDEHHTVEDVALALGQAIREALGEKRGIGRYGFVVPMDEAQARVAIDLSGRAASRFDAVFPRDRVGELSTEMVQHFFKSLADSLGAALHVEVSGDNTHHMVEACFKAVGRALGQAVSRAGTGVPSTKGSL